MHFLFYKWCCFLYSCREKKYLWSKLNYLILNQDDMIDIDWTKLLQILLSLNVVSVRKLLTHTLLHRVCVFLAFTRWLTFHFKCVWHLMWLPYYPIIFHLKMITVMIKIMISLKIGKNYKKTFYSYIMCFGWQLLLESLSITSKCIVLLIQHWQSYMYMAYSNNVFNQFNEWGYFIFIFIQTLFTLFFNIAINRTKAIFL